MNLFYIVVSEIGEYSDYSMKLVSCHLTENGANNMVNLLSEQALKAKEIDDKIFIWESEALDSLYPFPKGPSQEERMAQGAAWDNYRWANKADLDYTKICREISQLRYKLTEEKRKALYAEAKLPLETSHEYTYRVIQIPGGE